MAGEAAPHESGMGPADLAAEASDWNGMIRSVRKPYGEWRRRRGHEEEEEELGEGKGREVEMMMDGDGGRKGTEGEGKRSTGTHHTTPHHTSARGKASAGGGRAGTHPTRRTPTQACWLARLASRFQRVAAGAGPCRAGADRPVFRGGVAVGRGNVVGWPGAGAGGRTDPGAVRASVCAGGPRRVRGWVGSCPRLGAAYGGGSVVDGRNRVAVVVVVEGRGAESFFKFKTGGGGEGGRLLR